LEVPRHLTPASSSPYNMHPSLQCWYGSSKLLLTISVPNCLHLKWSHAPFAVYSSNCPRVGPCLWSHSNRECELSYLAHGRRVKSGVVQEHAGCTGVWLGNINVTYSC
jgi:hypothetical protein